jgi:hypothetical protein
MIPAKPRLRGHARITLASVPSSEVEAYGDSFVNWVRFNHRDIPSAFIYVAFCAIALGLAWTGNELANHFLAMPKILPCGTIGCHHVTAGTLPPIKHPLIPTYTPPSLTP